MDYINDNLISMWPCAFCLLFGYCLSACTLGLSLCCPYCCIWQATSELVNDINKMNKLHLNPKGLHMSLQKRCCTSWLQIDITGIPEQINMSKEEEDDLIKNKLLNNN